MIHLLQCSDLSFLFPSHFYSWLYPTNPVICPFCCSHLLSSPRGAVAFGGWHGGRRWARRVHRGPPSLPVTLFPLPSTSGLPAQERLRRRPPGHGLRLQPWNCSGGKANPQQQGQAEEKVCKFDPSFPFFMKMMNGFGSRDTLLIWNILVELYVHWYHRIAQYHPRLLLRLKCDPIMQTFTVNLKWRQHDTLCLCSCTWHVCLFLLAISFTSLYLWYSFDNLVWPYLALLPLSSSIWSSDIAIWISSSSWGRVF